jgi:hypothetical protein
MSMGQGGGVSIDAPQDDDGNSVGHAPPWVHHPVLVWGQRVRVWAKTTACWC